MRIIGGEFRKRRLQGPPDSTVTRPISDMVKESLFNLLRGHPEDGAVLDCFAGTGSIGLEALSRGSPRCVFVERDRKIAEILRANIEACGAGDQAEVVVGDALGPGALSRCPRPVHLVFFDPPYAMVRNAASWVRVKEQFSRAIALLDDTGYAVLRTPWPFFHAQEEAVPDEGSFGKHVRREHVKRDSGRVEVGEDGLERMERRERRAGRAGTGAFEPAPGADLGPTVGKRGRGDFDSGAGKRGTTGGDGPGTDGADENFDDMEEIEVDFSTPEGRALLKELMEGGAIEIGDDGEQIDAGATTREQAGAAMTGASAEHRFTRGDLSVPGAVGPETHAYGGMAVHLYMKQKSGS